MPARLGRAAPHSAARGPGPGAAAWTIIKGIRSSAVSLFFLNEGADEGELIAQREFAVSRRDDVTEVYRKVTEINIELLAKYVPLLLAGQVVARPQPPGGSVWERRRPEDGLIDWTKSASEVYDWIRALAAPYPGAFTFVGGRKLFVHSADLIEWGEPASRRAPCWRRSGRPAAPGCWWRAAPGCSSSARRSGRGSDGVTRWPSWRRANSRSAHASGT